MKNGEKSDIIKLGGTGSKTSGEHFVTNSGKIDPKNSKAVQAELEKFITQNTDSQVEKCLVISKNGDMFTVHGNKYTVNTELLGNAMAGSTNIHNHVKGMSQYSFSYEDLKSSTSDGTAIALACDEKYVYSMTIGKVIDDQTVYSAYKNAFDAVEERMFKGENITFENVQHERISAACEILNIRYRRENNDL